jgi:hypothetical protein
MSDCSANRAISTLAGEGYPHAKAQRPEVIGGNSSGQKADLRIRNCVQELEAIATESAIGMRALNGGQAGLRAEPPILA